MIWLVLIIYVIFGLLSFPLFIKIIHMYDGTTKYTGQQLALVVFCCVIWPIGLIAFGVLLLEGRELGVDFKKYLEPEDDK